MLDGQRLLEENNITEAFVRLDDGFDMDRSILDQQVLLFLPYLYHLLLPSRGTYPPEIVVRLLRFISQMASICSPQQHPIQQLLKLLGRMSSEDRGESSRRVLQSVLDRVVIEFNDIPELLEKDLNVLCPRARIASATEQGLDNYELISIAARELARDGDELCKWGTEYSQPTIAEDEPPSYFRFPCFTSTQGSSRSPSADGELTLSCKSLALRLDMEKSQKSASTTGPSHLHQHAVPRQPKSRSSKWM
jgi:hypothetical protein